MPYQASSPSKIPSSCRHTPSHTPSDLQQAPPHTSSSLKQSHLTTHLCKPEPISKTESSHPTANPKRLTPSQTTIASAIANIHHRSVKYKMTRIGTTEASSSQLDKQRPTASTRRQRTAPQDDFEDTTEVEDVALTHDSNVDAEVEDIAATHDSNVEVHTEPIEHLE
ncbi:hypothetical protein L3X38_022454 [Prunus dulcis]|uniref:Uncharacterized protein n=1 Tax=Prunus dulcis TaxID=3755 RepID=A0AAD4VW09_PRUDU|nr:hypothetical protein L3X38_022454 [Prunus dulcis]